MESYHIPVLLKESVDALSIGEGGIYADVTFGGGGHSRAILERMDSSARLFAMDRDQEALANAPDDRRLTLINNNFRFLRNYLHLHGVEYIDGILADLGVSSHQFDTEQRGFSFRFDSPLDMRMNKFSKCTAADILNSYSQGDLTAIFKNYGEVEKSGLVAQLICKEREKRKIETSGELNRVLAPILPRFAEHKYLAKIYQALRIETNSEMRALEYFLKDSLNILKPGGRLVVITYHSLEDRMVKNFMRSGNISGKIEKDLYGKSSAPFSQITGKPIVPKEEEIASNTRARSAKMRVAEKVSGKKQMKKR